MPAANVVEADAASGLMPAPAGCAWIVVHTRPRAEKKLAGFCELNRFPVYLPLRKKTHRYGGRVRSFSSPLFPGYLFCVVDPAGRLRVRQNRYVANVLDVVAQTQLVEQLRQIQKAIAVTDVVEILPYLEKGKMVRVTAGPFKGLEGVVCRVQGRTKVVVNVDIIGQAAAVEVDHALLAPA